MENEVKEKARFQFGLLKSVIKEGNWKAIYILGVVVFAACLLFIILILSII